MYSKLMEEDKATWRAVFAAQYVASLPKDGAIDAAKKAINEADRSIRILISLCAEEKYEHAGRKVEE